MHQRRWRVGRSLQLTAHAYWQAPRRPSYLVKMRRYKVCTQYLAQAQPAPVVAGDALCLEMTFLWLEPCQPLQVASHRPAQSHVTAQESGPKR
jgi:hypothetical protein